MMRGLVMIDRDILDHPSFAEESYTERDAFIWMICEASYTDRRVRTKKGVVHLKRGQLTASTRFMAEKWGWKQPRVRRFLKRLKIDSMIDPVTDSHQTIITICNYNKYQNFDLYRDSVASRQTTQQRPGNDPVATQTITPEETPDVIPDETPEGALGEALGRNDFSARQKRPEGTAIPLAAFGIGAENPKPPDQPNDVALAVAAWNTLAAERGLAKLQKLTTARRSRLRARLKDCRGLEGWQAVLGRIRGSPGLLGNNDSGWKVNFDFLVKEGNFVRLMEGKYDNWGSKTNSTRSTNGGHRNQGQRKAAFLAGAFGAIDG